MRILSKVVDYYDFIGKRYGEDANCVYLRGTIKEHRGYVIGPRATSCADFPDDSLDDYFRLESHDELWSHYLTSDARGAGYNLCRVVAGPHVVTMLIRLTTKAAGVRLLVMEAPHMENDTQEIRCEKCGHECSMTIPCPKCGSDLMQPGDRLCVDCDADERDAPESVGV